MEEEIQEEQGGEGGAPEPKISLVLGVLGFIVFLFLDLISLIPFVGDFEGILGLIGAALSFVSEAGGFLTATIGTVTLAKMIPGLQEVPLWTPAWCVIWYAENHPSAATNELLQVAQTTGSMEGGEGAGGAGGLGEEAGAAAKEGAAAAEEGGELAQEGASAANAGEAAEEAGAAGKAAEGAEAAEEGADWSDVSDAMGGNNKEEEDHEMTPDAERDPVQVEAEQLNMPEENFDRWDDAGKKAA